MPIYVYACSHCGKTFEVIQRFSDKPLTDCPDCKTPTLEKVIAQTSPPKLVGTGFYQTDYGGKSPK